MPLLIAFLLGILTGIKRTDPINKTTNPNSQGYSGHPVSPIDSRAQLIVDANHRSEKSKGNGLNIYMAVIHTLTMVGVIWYAIITSSLLKTTDATFHEVQQQTTLMRQQLVGSQEAVLDTGIVYNDGSHELTVQLINNGHVNATAIQVKIDASQQRIKDGTIVGKAYHFEPQIPPIGGGGRSYVWTDKSFPWNLTERERQQGGSWPKDWPGNRTFVFRAEVRYQNGFADERHSVTCRQWLPGFTITYAANRSSSGGGLYDCADIQSRIKAIQEDATDAQRAQQ